MSFRPTPLPVGDVHEGAGAEAATAAAGRSTTSRDELRRRHGEKLDELSPDVGVLDDDAVARSLADDPDATLAVLADLTGTTDPRLRALARALAGRVVVELARGGRRRSAGIGTLELQPLGDTGGDIDVDASLDALLSTPIAVDELRGRVWSRPATALCLVVDRSGSMHGERLATAAVAAAAVALRAPTGHAVLAFNKDVVVVRSMDGTETPEVVVDRLLRLRGMGTTDLALALSVAGDQLGRSRARRKVCVVLSDCRHNQPSDPRPAAAALDELVVIAPEDDAQEAEVFAQSVGARLATLTGPADVVDVFSRLLPGG